MVFELILFTVSLHDIDAKTRQIRCQSFMRILIFKKSEEVPPLLELQIQGNWCGK